MANLTRSVAKRLRLLADAIHEPPVKATEPAISASPVEPEKPQEAGLPANHVPGRFIGAPPQAVEVEASPQDLQRLVDLTAETWTRLGEANAHWSVLSWPEFLAGEIDEAKFFRTGVDDVNILKTFFDRSGGEMPVGGRVLELGCGVGRLTGQFGPRFAAVTAVDISRPHLTLAARHLSEVGVQTVDFVHLTRPDVLDALPPADLFYSLIVLQHNPPPVAYDLLRRCLERVAPGGYAYFQVPTYRRDYSFSVSRYTRDKEGRMEMHVLPQGKVLGLLQRLGFEILEVHEDGSVGDLNMMSHTFFARR